MTLCVDKAEWLDKDAPHVRVDLDNGTATGLPDGVRLGEITRSGTSVAIEFISPPERQGFAQIFTSFYWDPQGVEYEYRSSSYSHIDDRISETIYLDYCPWDMVELEAGYSSISVYDQPVQVPLTNGCR